MKTMKKQLLLAFSILGLILFSFSSSIKAVEVAPKITDREIVERLTRLEEGQKSLNKRFDDMYTLMLWGFGILFAGIYGLIGFVIYDRQKAKTVIQEEVVKLTRPQSQKIEQDLDLVKQDIVRIKHQLNLA